ncbi:MAG: 3-dehydroquinate synthase [Eggerthellaceae bacterium]|nr:3-dehydroquinate synthase [Eggerthellaceae bacterium]
MPTAKVVVNLPGKPSYDVRIGAAQLPGLGQRLRSAMPQATSAAIITDTNVNPLYGAVVRDSLRAAGLSTMTMAVPAGEASKNPECLMEIWKAMANRKMDRDAVVVALGGGVVGDMAGFAAATYLRGIAYVQVPTTLLAMVDSSVGGKTAIDLEQGKNLVGAFKQPAYVCADVSTLETLDAREWACGCGEIAKSAVIDSDDFFFWLVEHAEELAARDAVVVQEAITRCVVFKAGVVAADEEERAGVRECLNYGHTLGHAIEKLAGYGMYSHGHAVAEGMRFAIRLGAALEGAPLELVAEQDALLDALNLPALDFSADPDEVLAAMRSDKKARGGRVRFVLPRDVGAWTVREVDDETLLEHLGAWARSKQA